MSGYVGFGMVMIGFLHWFGYIPHSLLYNVEFK